MSDDLKFPVNGVKPDRDALDESLLGLIRDVYVPPGGDSYWPGLEQRIMARIVSHSEVDAPWWSVLAPWARPALVAAAAIFALAGVINRQFIESDLQLAYDSVLQSVTPDVVATSEEIISVERGTDGATISYFLSH